MRFFSRNSATRSASNTIITLACGILCFQKREENGRDGNMNHKRTGDEKEGKGMEEKRRGREGKEEERSREGNDKKVREEVE